MSDDANKPLDPSDQKKLKARGHGFGASYKPFIQIQDLSSSGESVRAPGRVTGRIHHLLSGIEFAAFSIFDWYHDTADIREQFPLPLEETIRLCAEMGIKHPQIRGKLKIVTTDLLVDFREGPPLAIAVKPVSELGKARTIEKLQIEKAYWEQAGVGWKLFTDREVSPSLKENLQWIRPALADIRWEQFSSEVEDSSSTELITRLATYSEQKATRCCARLDDEYGLEPGSHVQMLRYGVATRQIKAPLQKAYHDWKCSELVFDGVASTQWRLSHAN
ncbi:MAG: heteromeric transposase endonuclease subunit TnsA [Shewanella indica]|uniref:Heteromeric transposase endonuclease subunit TnsA n=1 Tax=Thalassospira indica TaxID=1891279 RepID=A0ABN5NP15_9PROT|nr:MULTISPECIES: heteromeric transposase endonuclease subunit TnsA [Pseudomonadota]AXO16116.1 heteromeric transposase endonuclease subunit TnsA [Thalassospira indica]OAZ08489.1 transcriptional antiterminator [Thalassospira profundimaris]